MANERVYIKLPIPGRHGDEFEYTLVDAARLHPGVLASLYLRTPNNRDGSSTFRPAFGMEGAVSDKVDPSEVVAKITELEEQFVVVSQQFGEHGQEVLDLMVSPLNLVEFTQLLAKGMTGKAAEVIAHSYYQLIAGASMLAEKLADRRALQVRVEELSSAVVTVAQDGDQLTDTLFLDWAASAEKLNQSTRMLRAIEGWLEQTRIELEGCMSRWSAELDQNHPRLVRAREFLDDGSESFNLKAYRYRPEIDADSRPEMEALVEEALQTIADCEAMEAAVRVQRDQHTSGLVDRLTPLRAEVERLCHDFTQATRGLADLRKRYGYLLSKETLVGRQILSEAEASFTEDILRDPLWSPARVKQRIESLRESVFTRLRQEVRLPRELADNILQAKRRIEILYEAWTSPTPKRESVRAKPVAVSEQPAKEDQPSGSLDDKTIQQVYEQVICIGYVLTCRPKRFAHSTARGLLKVLVQLGRIQAEQIPELNAAISQILHQAGEVRTLKRKDVPLKHWESARTRWIKYRHGKHQSRMKLSASAASVAESLLIKHSLTAEVIREAHSLEKRRSALEYEQRKAQCLAEGEQQEG